MTQIQLFKVKKARQPLVLMLGCGWLAGLLIGSETFGENRMSFTVPRCPGSLYSNFLDSVSHTATLPSAPPAPIFSPVGDQPARIRFFSMPAGAPSYLRPPPVSLWL